MAIRTQVAMHLYPREITGIVLFGLMTGFIGLSLIPYLMSQARKHGLMALPTLRKRHRGAVPLVGGLSVCLSILLGHLAIYFASKLGVLQLGFDWGRLLIIAASFVPLFVVGYLDDRYQLGATPRFIAQSIAALGVLNEPQLHALQGLWINQLGVLGYVLPAVWIVGVMNAFNMVDGVDGLAGLIGLKLIALSAALIAFVGDATAAGFLFMCLGPVVAFIEWNRTPAKIYLGEVGTQALGYLIAIASLWIMPRTGAMQDIWIPVIFCGYLVIEAGQSFTLRIMKRRSPFQGDRNHLHHRLLRIGFSVSSIPWACGLIASAFALLGAMARLGYIRTEIALLLAAFGVLTVLSMIFGYEHRVRVLQLAQAMDLVPSKEKNRWNCLIDFKDLLDTIEQRKGLDASIKFRSRLVQSIQGTLRVGTEIVERPNGLYIASDDFGDPLVRVSVSNRIQTSARAALRVYKFADMVDVIELRWTYEYKIKSERTNVDQAA